MNPNTPKQTPTRPWQIPRPTEKYPEDPTEAKTKWKNKKPANRRSFYKKKKNRGTLVLWKIASYQTLEWAENEI